MMRAVGYKQAGDASVLTDIELPEPEIGERDVCVEIRAISVNPVDTKVRRKVSPTEGAWKVLGWDAAGIVTKTGKAVRKFKNGDKVFYAGDLSRQGTNAQFHAVDERIVGLMPHSLGFGEAAALPLTAITAWEALFDRLEVRRPVASGDNSLLVIGGSGGVASIAIQLARQLTTLKVIATASNERSRNWVTQMGAHAVLDHGKPLVQEMANAGLSAPGFVFSTTQTSQHLMQIAEFIAPQGRLAVIDDPAVLDINPFKRKSVSVHWELMFTRSMYGTADIHEQGRLLDEVARLVDAGKITSTLGESLGLISAGNLHAAHQLIESGRTRGKVVLEGFA